MVKNRVAGFILSVLLVLLLLNAWMYLQLPAMIFYPSNVLEQTPKDWHLDYKDVYIKTADARQIHGWLLPKQDSRKVVLFFHGNAGNISHRRDSIAIFNRLGLNVFIIDYRGYGLSQGKPTEGGLYLDAKAAWNYLLESEGFDQKDIIIFGRSLGASVATRLASTVKPAALILESAFSSVRDMARHLLPVVSHLIVFRFSFNAAARIRQVDCPLLVMHSPDDEIIPFQLGQKIFQAANQPKYFVKMMGDHNNGFLYSQPEYERQLRQFIELNVAEPR